MGDVVEEARQLDISGNVEDFLSPDDFKFGKVVSSGAGEESFAPASLKNSTKRNSFASMNSSKERRITVGVDPDGSDRLVCFLSYMKI